MTGSVKLLMSWDIQPGREEDYFEFHIRKFVPALEGLGVALSEAWLTVYGEQPRLMAEAVMPDLASARQLLDSNDWEDLGSQMEELVENFDYKLVAARGGFQI
ncbi:MAG: hypothetical protein KIS80_03755 [Anaerolineales bacterium]|nr:hypothetical protein [Anaerolineales bacterium]MCW5855705.1 hypothetical protein [Anaerolineales bacterium]MCW5877966.1 hypothetical protein [Anaerolineales bacterium]